MKRLLPYQAIALAASLLLAGCQTKPGPAAPPDASVPAAPSPESSPAEAAAAPAPALAQPSAPEPAPVPTLEPSEISPETEGFWPAPESRAREISISVLIGNEKLLSTWRVEIAPASGAIAGAVKTFAGAASDLPGSLTWNGLGPGGKLAREGLYTANLSADFSGGLPALSLKSKPFALSLSPPEPVLYANPSRLERSADGIKKPVTFELAARAALARLDSWRLDLVGPDGRLFIFFEGTWPSTGTPAPISWDGRSGALSGSEAGALVEAGKRYAAILSVRDVYGHAASTQAGIAVADLPFPSERSSVQPWTNGFSPNGDKVMDSMDFSLGFGQRSAIRSWRLDIVDADKAIVRDFHGLAPDLPESISWDGKDSAGALASEGRYIATLHIDYGSTFSPAVARSSSFILDVTPPALRLSPSPTLFSPASPISIRLDASSLLARVADWSIEILDPGNHVFARFGGPWPAAAISWDGMGADGSLVEPAETYRIVARARDEFGNSSQAEANVETDIFVTKEGEGYRVNVASILFKGYTDDYEDLPADQVAQNKLTLDRLAAEFSRFPGYRIRLIGHAVMINWDDPNLGKPEQEKILIPLSKSRAAAIANALAARGIDAARMIVEGVGSTKPVVPDSDLVNRWKNRRVEFYLEK